MMTVYHLDAETFAKLEGVLTALYGHGEVLTADARRDLAHRLGLIRDTIASCAEQVEETPATPMFADTSKHVELPPGYSWYVRETVRADWLCVEPAGWSFTARDKATAYPTYEAAHAAATGFGFRTFEVKSAPTYTR